MSEPLLDTKLSPESDAFRANAAHNCALADRLRADVAHAALGGSEKARHRHVARGKLLPRYRVERLLAPGSPFLDIGQLATTDLYGDRHGVVSGTSSTAPFYLGAHVSINKKTKPQTKQ